MRGCHAAHQRATEGCRVIYRCSCGKEGVHDHGLRFTFPVEGRMVANGKEYEIVRTMLPYPPCWKAIRV
jgi:hypothetical protein